MAPKPRTGLTSLASGSVVQILSRFQRGPVNFPCDWKNFQSDLISTNACQYAVLRDPVAEDSGSFI